ncbi:MAG: hypothetical protein ABMB14_10205, partial [Myxococcota bacterium]
MSAAAGGLGPELDAAVSEALGALAFADVVPTGAPVPLPEPGSAVSIPLLGPLAGVLVLCLREDHADALTAAAWGALAQGGGAELREMFLFELANVVAGRVLALRYPGEPIRIGFPRMLDRSAWPSADALRGYELDSGARFG